MKRSLYYLLALLLLSCNSNLKINPLSGKTVLDEKYGFNNVKLESRLEELNELIVLEDNGDFATYFKIDDINKLGAVDVTGIEYNFYKKKLRCITVEFDYIEYDKLLEALTELYGQPAEMEVDDYLNIRTHEWDGNEVNLILTLRTKGNSYTKYTAIDFTSKKVNRQIRNDEIEENLRNKESLKEAL